MRVLITSKDHPNYDETGIVVADKKKDGLEVKLERSGEVVLVPEGQWKFVKMQESKAS